MFNDLSKRVGAIKPSPTLAVSNLARQLRAQGRDDLNNDVDVANLLLEEVGVALVPGSGVCCNLVTRSRPGAEAGGGPHTGAEARLVRRVAPPTTQL